MMRCPDCGAVMLRVIDGRGEGVMVDYLCSNRECTSKNRLGYYIRPKSVANKSEAADEK